MIQMLQKKSVYCPRIEAFCPKINASDKKKCFLIMAYDEENSYKIEDMLKKAVKKVLKLEPILAKEVKKTGSTDFFCTKVCKEIQNSTYCITDITYKNTNVGFEYGLAQRFNKPIIITQYKPKLTKSIEKNEKKILEKLKKAGNIQYAPLPLPTASDFSAIFNIMYTNEKDLKTQLKKGIEVK